MVLSDAPLDTVQREAMAPCHRDVMLLQTKHTARIVQSDAALGAVWCRAVSLFLWTLPRGTDPRLGAWPTVPCSPRLSSHVWSRTPSPSQSTERYLPPDTRHHKAHRMAHTHTGGEVQRDASSTVVLRAGRSMAFWAAAHVGHTYTAPRCRHQFPGRSHCRRHTNASTRIATRPCHAVGWTRT